ncbi:MAG: bifunctional diaminohydroxyphosphoribosylaminopyrimidine deaminase/5-amino-6-(5-phosphoribosylamino)uracil reductase RibD [Deltaproteobacteria bacterium]|nr:bifunctional diaminohydroxyphosphoribosylaminopyrimidine deaminase/5-amino-6-(5-phosphoribosylamino)uracil reductase RibD [Deltaproteobacteria bacterium]
MSKDLDEQYMRLALRLALRGAGRTSPNPMVGAVLVHHRKIIATGYHRRAGEDHAEIAALKRAGEKARGATLYLNLEPCDHHGRTPPCTLSVIRAGVRKVVAGMVDPNPQVRGRGIRRLRRAGIEIRVGVLEAECRTINEAFGKYINRRIPFVILKLAASLDGRIATATGDSHWITEVGSRKYVHRLRNQVDALIVGAGTAVADDPQLTCRIPGGRNPMRMVLDARLRIPVTARLFHQREPEKTIVVTGPRAPLKKIQTIRSLGSQVWSFQTREGGIPFAPVLKKLGRMGLLSIMIEGGAVTATRALRERVVDKVLFFYAPKLIGGDGKPMLESLNIKKMRFCRQLKNVTIQRFGKDFLVSGYL